MSDIVALAKEALEDDAWCWTGPQTPEIVRSLVAEIDRLEAIEGRVRALHSPVTDITDELVCTGCGVDYGDCPTIDALESQP